MVRYFEEDLKPSIKAKIDQDTSHLNNYKEVVAKAVKAKAQTGLRPSSYIWETDQQVSEEIDRCTPSHIKSRPKDRWKIIAGTTLRLRCLFPPRKWQFNALMTLRTLRKLGRRRRKASRTEEGTKRTPPQPSESTQLTPRNELAIELKNLIRPMSRITTITKRATMPTSIRSQNSSSSLGDLFVGVCN